MRRLLLAATMSICIVSGGHAQLDELKGALGGTNSGAGNLGLPSVSQASPGNLAGVLQYCVRNNVLSGTDASSLSNSLLNKTNGQSHDSGYQSGSRGLLATGNGQNFSLGGGGIKQQITQKICDLVLQRAKSLI